MCRNNNFCEVPIFTYKQVKYDKPDLEMVTNDPTMSDTSILVTVEDLINRAMGAPNANTVDFKLVQIILEILARQQRMLQQRIEIRIIELQDAKKKTTRLIESSPTVKQKRKTDVAEAEEKSKESKKKDAEIKTSEEKTHIDKTKEIEKLEKQQVKIRKEQKKQKILQKDQKDLEKDKQVIVKEKNISERVKMKENVQEIKQHEKTQEKTQLSESAEEKITLTKTTGFSGIEVTEKEIDKEKILVVERGPTTFSDSRSTSGIDFVSRSDFELLEAAVKELNKITFPKLLLLPENEELLNDLKKGTATLSKTMQALQVNERMKSAEKSMTTIVDMLTQLASTGALPEEIAAQVETILPTLYEEAEKLVPTPEEKSVGTASKAGAGSQVSTTPCEGPSTVNKLSATSMIIKVPCVTFEDMKKALQDLRNDVLKFVNKTINKSLVSAELSNSITKTVAVKLNVIQRLESRISVLYSWIEDQADYVNEICSGLNAQLQKTEGQIAEMQSVIIDGVLQITTVNNNAQIAAVMAITKHCEEMESKLDDVVREHKSLTAELLQFNLEMRNLLECMNMMRDEKSGRQEVLDAVLYKAGTSQLVGLLVELDFDAAIVNLQRRLNLSHERFNQSIAKWAEVVNDLRHIIQKKADLAALLSQREATQAQLHDLNNKIKNLTGMLGDPEVAKVTWQLGAGAMCGVCHEWVLMEPLDISSGVPLKLSALRKTTLELTKETPKWISAAQPTQRKICHRWCGGSHTMADPKKGIQLHFQIQMIDAKKYTDYGEDGKLYMFEEELQPCIECNALGGEKTPQRVQDDVASKNTPETEHSVALVP